MAKQNPAEGLQKVRVVRIDLDRNIIGEYDAPYVLDRHTREGYRHKSTVTTPDGQWAVVTLVMDGLQDIGDPGS